MTITRAHKTLVLGEIEHVFSFLQYHRWSEDIDTEFSSAMLLSKIVLQATQQDPVVFLKMVRIGSEVR